MTVEYQRAALDELSNRHKHVTTGERRPRPPVRCRRAEESAPRRGRCVRMGCS